MITVEPKFFASSDTYLVGTSAFVSTSSSASQAFGLLAFSAPLTLGNISIILGPKQSSAIFSYGLLPLSEIRSIPISGNVYSSDAPLISLILVSFDAFARTPTLAAVLYIRLMNLATSATLKASCSTVDSQSNCTLNQIIPNSWFLPGASNSVIVSSSTGVNQPWVSIFNFVLLPLLVPPENTLDIVATLPQRKLFAGELFISNITYVDTVSFTSSFSLLIQVSGPLVLEEINADPSIWTSNVQYDAPNNRASITAVTQNANPGSVPALLCQLQIRVNSVLTDLVGNVSVTILEWNDNFGNSLHPAGLSFPAPALVIGKQGPARGTNSVYLQNSLAPALLVETTGAHLINTAVLNGATVKSSLKVSLVQSNGQKHYVTDGITCNSNQATSVVQVSFDCTTVYVNGSEFLGGVATIKVFYGALNLSSSIDFFIWYPSIPLKLVLTDYVLNPIQGYFIDCAQQYQSSEIHIFANFSLLSTTVEIQVTDLLRNGLSATNAIIDNAYVLPIVQKGEGVGTASIQLGFGNSILAAVALSIANDFTIAIGITAFPVSDIQLVINPSSLTPLHKLLSQASIVQQMTNLEQSAYVYGAIIFSDGTQSSLEYGQFVNITSTDKNIFVVNRMIFPISSSNASASLNLLSSCHDTTIIAMDHFAVPVILDYPVNMIATLGAQSISPQSDLAAQPPSNLPIYTALSVQLVFNSGRILDITNSAATIYDFSEANGLLNPVTSLNGQTVVFANNSNPHYGNATVIVRYINTTISTQLVISVVRVVDFQVIPHPYPTYPQSNKHVASILNPISFSGAFQSAVLTASLIRSDMVVLDASVDSHLSFAFSASGLDQISTSNIVLLRQLSSGTVITRSATASYVGNIVISASFYHLLNASFTIQFSATPIAILALVNLRFIDTLVNTATVHVGVLFNDTTQLLDVFAGSVADVTGLVTLTTNPIYASASSSGIVTAIGNTYQPIQLQVSSSFTFNGALLKLSTQYSVNLAPSLGDVDMGNNGAGEALLAIGGIGSVFSTPLRVNTGTSIALAVQLEVLYDPQALKFVSFTPGANWGSAELIVTHDNPPGILFIGGLSGGLSGTAAEAVVLSFQAIGDLNSVTYLNASVVTLSDAHNEVIGAYEGSFSQVGSTPLLIGSLSAKRSVTAVTNGNVRSEKARTQQSRKSACGFLLGDANGDCIVNLRDAVFIQSVVTIRGLNGTYLNIFSLSRLAVMDTDDNGYIDLRDVEYLVRTIFKYYRFISSPVSFKLSSQASCLSTISVSLVDVDGNPASGNTTSVLFDVESNDPELRNFLPPLDGAYLDGSVLLANKQAGFNGQLVQAANDGQGNFYIKLATNGFQLSQPLGISLLIVTFDDDGTSNIRRISPLLRKSTIQPEFLSSVNQSVLVRGFPVPIVAQGGYSPLATFNDGTINNCTVTTAPSNFSQAASSSSSLLALLALLLIPAAILIAILYVRRKRTQKNTFVVGVAKKVDDRRPDKHPFEEDGSAFGYEVRTSDDPQFILGREVWLVRQVEYTFKFLPSVTKEYPFYLTTSDYGGGNAVEEYLEGVRNSPATFGQNLKFTPGLGCPDLLYFQCSKHKSMGYRINIVDSEAQVGRPVLSRAPSTMPEQTPPAEEPEPIDETESEEEEDIIAAPAPVYRAPPPYSNVQRISSPRTVQFLPTENRDPSQVTISTPEEAPVTASTRKAPAYIPPPSYVASLKFISAGKQGALHPDDVDLK